MAKLITDHDPMHIHKILGVLVLIHYLYRFALLFKTGTAFPEHEDPIKASICVSLHGLLSWSSLLLPLPVKRNFGKPMIWIEFRLHSILYATRHVISTILSLNDLWPSSENMMLRTMSKIFLVVATSRMAALITSMYDGSQDNRTTNTMPYPKWTTNKQQRYVKYMYAKAQFFATVGSMYDDPNLNFVPVLAIQIAPLMMTLVRKGKANAFEVHRIYALSLWLSYLGGAARMMVTGDERLVLVIAITGMVIRARIAYGLPHWLLWSIHGLITFYLYPVTIHPFMVESGMIEYMRKSSVLFLIPLGFQVHECIIDPRPFVESIGYWPFLKLSDDHYEKRFLLTKYHKLEVAKKEMIDLKSFSFSGK